MYIVYISYVRVSVRAQQKTLLEFPPPPSARTTADFKIM